MRKEDCARVQANAPPPASKWRAGGAFSIHRPEISEGRWSARRRCVHTGAPVARLAARAHLRNGGDDRPMTGPARLPALHRGDCPEVPCRVVARTSGAGSRRRAALVADRGLAPLLPVSGICPFQGERLLRRRTQRSTLASSWRGIVVSPGGAPTPPGRELTRLTARAPRKLVSAQPPSPLRDRPAHLRPRIPLAPSNQRHRLTPLDEQGA